ncbi:MAG TPA: NAD-dependent epimerase/dehydratase family protein [Pirellulales bacterium]|nr:NAD-dependent epimerase/dehydratase family protein [Pirellulales bacterium]
MSKLPQADLEHILERTRDLWEGLRGERLFLTGGTGFFGCWLLESLLWANDRLKLGSQVVVLTRDAERFARKAPHIAAHAAVRLHLGDVRVFACPPGRFSHIVHAATDASAKLNEQSPGIMFDTIVAGTRRVLDFAATCGVRKLLLASSGAIYGKQPPDISRLPEDFSGAPDPLALHSAYGEGKRVAEMLCAQYGRQFGFDALIARCFAFVGPHLPLDEHFAVGNFMRDAMAGRPISIHGDGTPLRSYMYAADLAIWLWTILFKAPSGRAYNVGSDHAVSILDTAHAVAEAVANPVAVRVAKTPDPAQKPARYVPSIDRARGELGLELTIPFAVALRRTIAWHHQQFANVETTLPRAG